jgi:hypothetical protein
MAAKFQQQQCGKFATLLHVHVNKVLGLQLTALIRVVNQQDKTSQASHLHNRYHDLKSYQRKHSSALCLRLKLETHVIH